MPSLLPQVLMLTSPDDRGAVNVCGSMDIDGGGSRVNLSKLSSCCECPITSDERVWRYGFIGMRRGMIVNLWAVAMRAGNVHCGVVSCFMSYGLLGKMSPVADGAYTAT